MMSAALRRRLVYHKVHNKLFWGTFLYLLLQSRTKNCISKTHTQCPWSSQLQAQGRCQGEALRNAHKLMVAGGPVCPRLWRTVTMAVHLSLPPELPAAARRSGFRHWPSTNPGWCGLEESDTFQPISSNAVGFASLGMTAVKKDLLGEANSHPVPDG